MAGRLGRRTVPDGEVITNAYDSGGNLSHIDGDKRGDHTTYLQTLLYDKFEQRTYLKLGNGIETRYSYRADNRRLARLTSDGTTADSAGRTAGRFQNLAYGYDAVGNIQDLANEVAIPPANSFGGPTAQHFGYDELYRLTSAQGRWQSSPSKVQDYTLAMSYDAIHNIVRKTQSDVISSSGNKGVEQKATSYDWAYAYSGAQPHAPSHIGERTFYFDANGNQTGWRNDKNGTKRSIVWDEDNRIREIDDNGKATRFKYDDQGQRVFKIGEQGETVYVNQFYVVRNRSIVSKHVFAGTSRIVTKLVSGNGNSRVPAPGGTASTGGMGSGSSMQGPGQGNSRGQGNAYAYGQSQDPPGQSRGNGNANGRGKGNGNSGSNGNNSGSVLPGNSQAGLENALANGEGHKYGIYKHLEKDGASVDASGAIVAGTTGGSVSGSPGGSAWKPEQNFLYYYHPDHLGSTGYVTDQNGQLYEHIEYFPFGETWVQEHSNTQRTPYLFTGKELDQETGLYYFGARYYDPRTSVWQSVDPIDRFTPKSPTLGLNLYQYGLLNPIRYVDPTGMDEEESSAAKPRTLLQKTKDAVSSAVNFVGEKMNSAQQALQDMAGNANAWLVSQVTSDPDKIEHARQQAHDASEGYAKMAVEVGAGGAAKTAVAVGGTVGNAVTQNASKIFSKEKQALVDMAKADKKMGMTSADMQAYKDLNKQLPDPFPTNKVRGPEAHSAGAPSSQAPHGHVGPVDHIPIRDPQP